MKRFKQTICVIMALIIFTAVPVRAEEASTYSNAYIAAYNTFLHKTAENKFQVWFDIDGTGKMSELGASCIRVQRRASTSDSWVTYVTYWPSDYPQMKATNTSGHASYVTYTGAKGYYYRAVITLYAKNSSGSSTIYDYAGPIFM